MTARCGRCRRHDDAGTALVEFTYLALVLMVPLVYVMLLAFTLQRAGFAASAAAREAGRAYVTADSDAVGRERAERVVAMTLADHDVDADATTLAFTPLPDLVGGPAGAAPTTGVRVEVRHVVELPVIGSFFGGLRLGSIPVTGEHVAVFDRFRSR
ncbi:MAG TPA: hypothetical protein VNA12_05260 [Mycobacteriales bacterium]|nr:hypothetical protein [Mycobacteriales bacterium]